MSYDQGQGQGQGQGHIWHRDSLNMIIFPINELKIRLFFISMLYNNISGIYNQHLMLFNNIKVNII